MKWLVLLIAVACNPRTWRDDPARKKEGPIARLAITRGTQLRVITIGEHGILGERAVELGKPATALVWASADPAVVLSEGEPHPAFVTDTGVVDMPPYAWPAAGELQALVGNGGATWEGRCAQAASADGRARCADGAWTFVRQQPLPQVARSGEVVSDLASHAAPPLAPPLAVVAAKRGSADYLTCTDRDGHAASIPETADPDFLGESPPIWLASDPPVFATEERGPAGATPHIVVDCRVDAHVAAWAASPSGVVAIWGDRLDIVYRGRIIGTTAGGDLVAFAPTASAPPAR